MRVRLVVEMGLVRERLGLGNMCLIHYVRRTATADVPLGSGGNIDVAGCRGGGSVSPVNCMRTIAIAVGVDAGMPGELVGATESLLAARVGAHERLLACVRPDVSRLHE